jgi:signal transduction histidine kinase
MSHELRTPLNAILGFSEIIGGEMFGSTGHPRYVDYAKDIYSSGHMLLQIIDDLLDLSRVEHGKLELHAESLTAKDVIEGCLRLVEGRAREARLRIAIDLPDRPLRFEADPLRLRQVLLNLLTNAVKFTLANGSITIGARRVDGGGADTGEIAFFVADTGIGMTQGEIALALQPFGQVANAMTRQHTGAGLGVPLAKGLTELHGGRLVIESKPGAGTRVTVTLPETRRKTALIEAKPSGPIPVELPMNITAGGFVARR